MSRGIAARLFATTSYAAAYNRAICFKWKIQKKVGAHVTRKISEEAVQGIYDAVHNVQEPWTYDRMMVAEKSLNATPVQQLSNAIYLPLICSNLQNPQSSPHPHHLPHYFNPLSFIKLLLTPLSHLPTNQLPTSKNYSASPHTEHNYPF